MSYIQSKLENINGAILEIQDISKAERSAILVGFEKERYYATYSSSIKGEAKRIATHDDNHVFAIASMFKIFIAAAAFLMIDKLSASHSPENQYHGLQGARHNHFTAVFNKYSKDFQLPPLLGDPTVLQLLTHLKGVYDMNHLLFGPDGTPLQSKNDFLKTVSQYSIDANENDKGERGWLKYSNANYILIALLIEVVSKMSLHEFLKIHIFEPLGMKHTYMSVEELDLHPPESRAQPHVVSSDGNRRAIIFDKVPGLADTVELAILGPYTSAADLGRFFGALQLALDGTPTGPFDNKLVHSLFETNSKIGKEEWEYKPGMLYTKSDTKYPGCHSLNRLISPDSEYSKHMLGKTFDGNEIHLCYLAGSATGWGCTAYFVPDKRVFVICLTNTSGPLDASDLISRLCLHEIFHLRPSESHLGFTFSPGAWGMISDAERYWAHYVCLADLMFRKNAGVMKALEKEDAAEDVWTAECGGICGKYVNKAYLQSLVITNCEGRLRVRLSGGSKMSQLMRFVPKGETLRLCSIHPHVNNGPPGLGIDCFGAWKNMEFKVEQTNNVVTCLSRKGLHLEDRFIRE